MWNEFQNVYTRFDTCLRSIMYDKSILQSDTIREDKNQIRRMEKQIGYKNLEKLNQESGGKNKKLVRSLVSRYKQF